MNAEPVPAEIRREVEKEVASIRRQARLEAERAREQQKASGPRSRRRKASVITAMAWVSAPEAQETVHPAATRIQSHVRRRSSSSRVQQVRAQRAAFTAALPRRTEVDVGLRGGVSLPSYALEPAKDSVRRKEELLKERDGGSRGSMWKNLEKRGDRK